MALIADQHDSDWAPGPLWAPGSIWWWYLSPLAWRFQTLNTCTNLCTPGLLLSEFIRPMYVGWTWRMCGSMCGEWIHETVHLDQFDDDLICHMCNPVVICVSVRSALCNNFLCECITNVTCYVMQCIRSCVWHLCDPFGICVNVTLCVIACVSAMAIT